MSVKSLDQKIATESLAVYKQITESFSKKKNDDNGVSNYIKKTATSLRVSGLGVTMAFCLRKNKKGEPKEAGLSEIAHGLATILNKLGIKSITANNGESLLRLYTTASSAEIRRIQTYAEQTLEWMGKWADTYEKRKD